LRGVDSSLRDRAPVALPANMIGSMASKPAFYLGHGSAGRPLVLTGPGLV